MNFSIKTKIISISALAVILCLGISLFANWRSAINLGIYKRIAEVNFPNIQVQADMEKSGILIEAAVNMMIGADTTAQEAKSADKKIDEALTLFNSSVTKYESLPFIDGEEIVWKKFKNEFWTKYVLDAKKIIELSGTGKVEDRTTRDQFANVTWKKNIEIRDEEFNGIQNFQTSEVKHNSEQASSQAALLAWLVPLLLAASGVVSLTLAYLLGTAIAKNLMEVTDKVKTSSGHVGAASAQIASSSEQLSQATTEQAASLQETSSSIEEISSMINANTENAKRSTTVSAESLGTAEKGKMIVGHMIKAITEIDESNVSIMNQIDETNKEIENIVKIINEIGNKTKVINDIVFQTKLLSFNASVEAARAGEQGKGFAVVAEEVGNLASMSGNAALEITNMLEASTRSVEDIVRNSKDKIGRLVTNGKEKVETGTRVANECEEVLNEIVASVASVSKMITEIASASQEQAQGVQEITKAIAQLDQVTQENTANSAQSANAAETLSNQADLLNSLVHKLVETIEGGQTSSV